MEPPSKWTPGALKRCIADGAPDTVDTGGCPALVWAGEKGKVDLVDALLDAGASPDAADDEGKTPLILAAMENKAANAERLLAAGADVTAKDEDGDTALGRAAGAKCMPLVETLLARMAPFGLAVSNVSGNYCKAPKLLDRLLEAGADPNVVGPAGWTALHSAASQFDLKIVRRLVEAGAKGDGRSATGETPLDMLRAQIQASYLPAEKKKARLAEVEALLGAG